MPLSLRFLYRHYWNKQWLSVILYKFLRKLAWRVVYELGLQCAGKRCIIGQMFGCLSRLLFEGEKCVSGILFYWWEAAVASKNFSVWFCFYLPNTHIQVNVWWVRSVKGGGSSTHTYTYTHSAGGWWTLKCFSVFVFKMNDLCNWIFT